MPVRGNNYAFQLETYCANFINTILLVKYHGSKSGFTVKQQALTTDVHFLLKF